MICTFFGHSDTGVLEIARLQEAIEELILKGVDTFYVGNQGRFDRNVFECLLKLKERYPCLAVSVVLAYLPAKNLEGDIYCGCSIYPEGLESGPPRFAIERRNKWMIDRSNYCLCYIDHTWGGAYKFVKRAKRLGLTVMNLGGAKL